MMLGKAGYFLVSLICCTLISSWEFYKTGFLDVGLKSFKQPQATGYKFNDTQLLVLLKCAMKIAIPFFLWLLFFFFSSSFTTFSGAFSFICFVFGLAYGQKVIVSIHVPLIRSLLVKYCCITNYSKISWLNTTNITGGCF